MFVTCFLSEASRTSIVEGLGARAKTDRDGDATALQSVLEVLSLCRTLGTPSDDSNLS